jgi:predicted phosphodiesterase
MIRSVDFVSQAAAEGLPGLPMQDSVAMISISTPGTWEPDLADFAHVLKLEFHDVEDADAEPWVVFDRAHAKAVIDFVNKLHDAEEAWDLIVHCKAGISRSAAVALYVADATNCAMPRIRDAWEANRLVLKVLTAESGLEVLLPQKKIKIPVLLFCGDTHGNFGDVLETVENLPLDERPEAVIFLGDLDPQEPLSRIFQRFLDAGVEPWFVHGNHETDHADTWANTLDCWERNLHGRVVNIAGLLVAGLGGVFREETWYPPAEPKFHSYDDYIRHLTSIQPQRLRDDVGTSKRARVASSGIFPDVVSSLSRQRANVLVCHEAPSIFENGFSAIDQLASDLWVNSVFSGHHHKDQHLRGNGFEAFQVGLRGIRDLSGAIIKIGDSA